MAAGSRHGRGADQLNVRVPDGLRDRLKVSADLNGRSLNAEIVKRLEASLRCIPVNENAEKDGPAEAATSPGHGSNNPRKGNAVNRQHDTTAPQAPAIPDFKQAFLDLDDLISAVRRPVRTLDFLIVTSDEHRPSSKDGRTIGPEELDAFYDTSFTAREAVDALEDRWSETHSALCAFERHSTNGYRDILTAEPQPDPLLLLVQEYEAGKAQFDVIARANPDLTDDDAERLSNSLCARSREALCTPSAVRPTTRAGAVGALRLIVDEITNVGMNDRMIQAVLPAVLGFFDREAA